MRQNFSSGTKWEPIVGYSRVVRVGNNVRVAGTTATDGEGTLIGGDDAYEQAKFILQKIEKSLAQAGASMADVVCTRTYITQQHLWQAVGKAHHEFFAEVLPVSTMVVAQLIGDEYLVEIEVEAIIDEG